MIDQIGSVFFYSFLGCVGLIVFSALCGLVLARKTPAPPDSLELITAVEPHAVVVDSERSWAKLEVTGREIFFPNPHDETRPALYEIRLTGTLLSDRGRADAFHRTDSSGNFAHEVDWLQVNGHPFRYVEHEIVQSNRCEHRYTILLHVAERLTLALKSERPWSANPTLWHGALLAEVTVLPAGTVMPKHRRELERRRAAEEAQAGRRAAVAKEESAAEADRFADVIKAITIRAKIESNWAEADFREKFARVHHQALLTEQREIRSEATRFLEQARVVQYFQRHNPKVIEVVLGRLNALEFAERHALDLALAPAVGKPIEERPPRKKLTAEEVRGLKIRRQRVVNDDRVALALDRIETRIMVRKRLEEMPLDPDEREMLEREMIDEIEAGEDDENTKTI